MKHSKEDYKNYINQLINIKNQIVELSCYRNKPVTNKEDKILTNIEKQLSDYRFDVENKYFKEFPESDLSKLYN